MKRSSGHFYPPTIMLLSLLLSMGCLSCKSQHKPAYSSKPGTTADKVTQVLDRLVVIRNTYTLQVPDTFSIQLGDGDDSQFLIIRSLDDALVLEYESSRLRQVKQEKIDSIKDSYAVVKEIESESGISILLSYDFIKTRFRDISGKIWIKEGDEYKEILDMSTIESKLPATERLLRTLALP